MDRKRVERLTGRWLAGLVTWLALALLSAGAMAADDTVWDRLQADFGPLSGVLIRPGADLDLVDLDADDGAKTGDLFVAATPGEPIVHPVTGETLGHSRDPVVYVVDSVERGFSRLSRLTGNRPPESGTPLGRFAGIKAALIADTDGGTEIYDRLRLLLPHILWQGRFSSEESVKVGPGLLFVLEDNQLRVFREGRSRLVARYALKDGQKTERRSSEHGGVGRSSGRFETLYSLDRMVRMAAFFDLEAKSYAAIVEDGRLEVIRLTPSATVAAGIDLLPGYQGYSVDVWWPPSGPNPWLIVTAAAQVEEVNGLSVETHARVFAFLFDGEKLVHELLLTGRLARTFDLDGDGRTETLLSQSFTSDGPGRDYLQAHMKGDELVWLVYEPPFSWRPNLATDLLADVDGDGRTDWLHLTAGVLEVHNAEGRQVYTSPPGLGGSLSRLTYDRLGGGGQPLFATQMFEVKPLVVREDEDGTSVHVPAGLASNVSAPGLGLFGGRSWIAAIGKDGDHFITTRLSSDFEAAIQGLALAGESFYLALAYPGDTFGAGARTDFIRLDLDSFRGNRAPSD
ncbi:MAG: hypothetical protein Tsb0017_02370 [Geothermobacteraceae bacterium]